jgi:hypothetical protein
MVPIKEMTDVLRVVKEQTGLKVKQWVRLKRGLYKDDIAQVDYVDLAQNQVHLKLLPRIDYTRLRGALRTTQSVSEMQMCIRSMRQFTGNSCTFKVPKCKWVEGSNLEEQVNELLPFLDVISIRKRIL